MRAIFQDLVAKLPIRVCRVIKDPMYLQGLMDATYGAPWREYHNYDHLIYMIDEAFDNQEAAQFLERIGAENELHLWFAVLFHDFVYDLNAKTGQNEHLSSIAAKFYIPQISNYPYFYFDLIQQLIQATIHHEHTLIDPLEQFIADLDLSSMSDHDACQLNSLKIQAEYRALYSPDVVKEGRCKFLSEFISRPKIYYHPFWLDQRAKRYLAKEYDRLAGLTP